MAEPEHLARAHQPRSRRHGHGLPVFLGHRTGAARASIALTFIAPLIALLLAALFLDEQIGPRSIAGSLAAFAGVIVIVLGQARAAGRPEVLLGSAAIIGSALCYAANIVLMRRQALAAKPLEINFFQSLTVMTLWLVAMPFVGVPAWPGPHWGWIAVASPAVDLRHLALRLGLCARRSELSGSHRI